MRKYEIGYEVFKTKAEIKKYYQEIKNMYEPKQVLTREHHIDVWHLLQYHPEKDEKIGVGISNLSVNYRDYGTTCFWILRKDGTKETFSYTTCIDNIPVAKNE